LLDLSVLPDRRFAESLVLLAHRYAAVDLAAQLHVLCELYKLDFGSAFKSFMV